MPNHCSQDLYVTGLSEDLKDFQEFAKESVKYTDFNGQEYSNDLLLSANKFIPTPEKNDHVWFNHGGYEWCLENWGTKWGIYDCALVYEKTEQKKGKLKYTFRSAWSPANKIIKAMSNRYPYLEFRLKYYEMGCQFQGEYTVQAGIVLVDITKEYKGRRGG